MRFNLPTGLLAFAREFSRYKTPAQRTQGWRELPHEVRGAGDVLDTVGTLMLWRFLVSVGLPATYFLTAGKGDETDLRVFGYLNINVKVSQWQPRGKDDPASCCHIAVKEIELEKPLADLYVLVVAHLRPSGDVPHVHLCRWIASNSTEFQRQQVQTIPNTGGSRGLWIAPKDAHPLIELPGHLKRHCLPVPVALVKEGCRC